MRRQLYGFTLALLICFCAACNNSSSNLQNDSLEPGENGVSAPQRIITLAPHLTELVFSLGAQDRIIATVEYSDYPEAAKNIPRVGDAFRIDWELLAKLKPDLILAWQGGNPQGMLDELQRRNYPVVALKNPELFTLPEQLKELAELLGTKSVVSVLAENYTQGLLGLQKKYSQKETVRVFYQIAVEPLYTIDARHTISEMLAVCGAENVFGDIGSIAAPVSVEAMLAVRPDVILTSNEMRDRVVANWSEIKLFKTENILNVPSDEVARASLRMLDGTRNICEILDVWRQAHIVD